MNKTLPKRMYQIASAVPAGLSNKEIAEHFGVTENTVRTHLKQVYSRHNLRRGSVWKLFHEENENIKALVFAAAEAVRAYDQLTKEFVADYKKMRSAMKALKAVLNERGFCE